MSIQLTVMSLDFDSASAPSTKVFSKDEITLGRYPENDLVLDRPEVSGLHARIRVEPRGKFGVPSLLITDLGSSNGTLVENNSLRAQVEVEVLPNERIIIGNYLIKPALVEPVDEAGEEDEAADSRPEVSEFDDSSQPVARDDGDYTVEVELAADDSLEESDISFSDLAAQIAEAGETGAGEEREIEAAQEDAGAEANAETSAEISAETSAEAVSEHSAASAKAATDEGDDLAVIAPASTRPGPAYAGAREESAEFRKDAAISIFVDGGDQPDLDFEATELFTLEGIVVHKGHPLAGVEIDAGSLGRTETDAEGRYSFIDVPEGTQYDIVARYAGYIFDCPDSAGVVSSDVTLPIRATQLFQVEGSVLHKGSPLAGVTVEDPQLGSTATDSNGRFRFRDVPEGSPYSLTFSKSKFIFEGDSLSGKVGVDGVKLQLQARELFTISGRVVHKGRPLAGVTVDGGEALGQTTTDEEGRYAFYDVPEGASYQLSVAKEKFLISQK